MAGSSDLAGTVGDTRTNKKIAINCFNTCVQLDSVGKEAKQDHTGVSEFHSCHHGPP
jgi:hypothetical protein